MATTELKSRTTTSDNQGNTTTTLEYLVHGLTAGATDATIAGTSGLPTLNDMFAGSGGAINVKRTIKVDADKSPTVAMVSVEYSTNPNATGGNSQPDNNRDPTTDPPKMSAHPQFATKTRQFDFSVPERAYQNGSGEILSDAPQVDDPRTIIVYEKNVANFVAAINVNGSHGGKINDSDFTLTSQGQQASFGAKTCLFMGVTLTQHFYTNTSGVITPYWAASYSFAYKGTAWNPSKIADYGFCELVDDIANPGKKRQQAIKDAGGVPIGVAVALSGGKRVDMTQPNAKAGTLTFNDYDKVDFSGLGLS